MTCRLLVASLLLVCCLHPGLAADPSGLLEDLIVTPDGARRSVDAFNSPLGNNRIVIYTPDFGPSTATVDAMVEIVVQDGVVTDVRPLGYTNTPIPSDGYVISGHGSAATWLRLVLRVGDEVVLLRNELTREATTASHMVHLVGPNVTRGADQLVIFTPGKERTGTNPWGLEAVVRDGVVVSIGGNDNPIPADGFVVSAHGTARDWLAANVREGAVVDVADGQITVAFDNRSVVRNALSYIDLADERVAAATLGGIPLDTARVKRHRDQARALLTSSDILQAQGLANEALHSSALALLEARQAALAALPAQPVGVRGVWYRPVEITPDHVAATLDRLARVGVNVLFLETFYRGRTVYPSAVAAQHSEFRRWDLLEVWIEEGKKRGIDVHLWLHVFRFDEYPSGTLLRAHPEWMASGPQTSVPEHLRANRASVDPAHPEVRAFVLAMVEEMLTRYKPAGIHLDYIRYPKGDLNPGSFTITDYSRQLFMEEYGVDPLTLVNERWSEAWKAWELWQEEQITSFVDEVRQMVEQLNPHVILSAAVVGEIGEARLVTRQNWVDWAERGLIDLLLPMLYNPDSAWVGRAVEAARRGTGDQVLISAGIGVYLDFTPELLVEQILTAEAAGSLGVTHFAFHHMNGAHFDALKPGLYSSPAVPPYRTSEALNALGEAILGSLELTGGPGILFRVGRALAAYETHSGPSLWVIGRLLDDALDQDPSTVERITPWQASLLRQAKQIIATLS